MGRVVLSEELLVLAKEIIDDYCVHKHWCLYEDTEVCNCGKTSRLKRYRELLETVNTVKESK